MLSSKQAQYQQNFSSPQGTVYVTEGNGAVPGTGPNATLSFLNASYPYGRVHGTGGAYGIITTSSTDKLTYESPPYEPLDCYCSPAMYTRKSSLFSLFKKSPPIENAVRTILDDSTQRQGKVLLFTGDVQTPILKIAQQTAKTPP